MKYLAVAIMVSLAWAHQDWWFWAWFPWDSKEEIHGIPSGLAYHVAFSFMTAAAWLLAAYKAWPAEIERWADAGSGHRRSRSRRSSRRDPRRSR